MMMRPAPSLLVFVLLVGGCAAEPAPTAQRAADSLPTEAVPVSLFEASDAAEKRWRKVSVWGRSEFRLVAVDDVIAIRAETAGSSGALVRLVDIDPAICPEVEWTWQVEKMPPLADLSSRASEDVAASIFFAFGDPGSLTNPDPVPTLRYAWATETNPVEQVIDSPYFPGVIRTLVVRSGDAEVGAWITERRNLNEDFETAFGRPPDSRIEVVAIFTDSDHGTSPAIANYRSAGVSCTEEPGSSIFDRL